MYAVVAERKGEPGERIDTAGWYGIYGIFRSLDEAVQCKKELNLKNGYKDIRVIFMQEYKAAV